jgi:hypothetical protein
MAGAAGDDKFSCGDLHGYQQYRGKWQHRLSQVSPCRSSVEPMQAGTR